MNVIPPFITNFESSLTIQLTLGSLCDLTTPSQALTRLNPRPRQPWKDTALMQGLAQLRTVIGTWAPDKATASGMPWLSITRWRIVPELPRSVGFGPVFSSLGVGTLVESITARLQSIWSASPRRSKSIQLGFVRRSKRGMIQSHMRCGFMSPRLFGT